MIATSLCLVIGIATLGAATEPSREPSQPVAAERVLIVPLRAHILTAPDLDLANCKLTDADVTRVVGKLNTIWGKAGIHFGLESIVREPAAQRDRFRLMAELNGGELAATDFQLLLPRQSRLFDGLHAVFFHELPFNGAYIGDDCAIVREGRSSSQSPGAAMSPCLRVLGFALGLRWVYSRAENPRRVSWRWGRPASNSMPMTPNALAVLPKRSRE